MAPAQRYNDGRCDRQGRFWVGSMNESITPGGSLYRVDPDGSLTHCFGDIIVPNSIAFSPDGRFFYFADTRRFAIWRFDLDIDSGVISDQTVFAQTTGRPGRPDGSCVDSEGFLWNAEYAGGQIVRYAPDGRIDRIVALPVTHPTSVCFGGPAMDTLFITSGSMHLAKETATSEPLAGAVLAINVGVKGLPEPRFGSPSKSGDKS
ncbi:SMP-30/gluconolactonase/LRE family protein [Rhodoferax sediminis]|uniref:SMP-30/gluconolactonase/LRE family protein n=1 Tax=Rhodoferax sediminis TaxID=2509614 RepID=A0A515DDV5_9BURK|nr:SMP-30/gluconolactonase/LRE family protein [Rhodoferax sediminis]QDL38608.1 SMP-30/gluconolactonase/LRE family protein [Rhodoferax sediminis]